MTGEGKNGRDRSGVPARGCGFGRPFPESLHDLVKDVRILINAGEGAASGAEGVHRNGRTVMAAGTEPGGYLSFLPAAPP